MGQNERKINKTKQNKTKQHKTQQRKNKHALRAQAEFRGNKIAICWYDNW